MVVMIIYSTGDDDSMICQWVTFQGCFEHQVHQRLAKKSDRYKTRFYWGFEKISSLATNLISFAGRLMDGT